MNAIKFEHARRRLDRAQKSKKKKTAPAPNTAAAPKESLSVLCARAGLSELGIQIAALFRLPEVFYKIMIIIFNSVGNDSMEIYCLETFAGAGKIALEFAKHEKRSLTFEKYGSTGKAHPHQDLCTCEGLTCALVWMVRMILGAALWEGTVCSTWVVLSRGSTKRRIQIR